MAEPAAGSRWAPSPGFLTRLVILLAITFALVAYWSYGRLVLTGRGTDLGSGVLLGGDWVVFHEAAHAIGTPRVDTLYRFDQFTASLRARYPGHGTMKFGWQYPPTMFLVLWPWKALGFRAGFALWSLVGLLGFAWTVHRRVGSGHARLLLATSPVVLLALVTGQTGFLTAALVAAALYAPERHPWSAGAAAGLLTIKPQLGLLIPVAYVARRAWGAIGVAAGTALVLALASGLLVGFERWGAFLEAVQGIAGKMQAQEFPPERFTSPYGFLQTIGAPWAAGVGQGIGTALLVGWTWWSWRSTDDPDWRFAAVASAIPLATPYAMYYELPMVALALTVALVRGAPVRPVGAWTVLLGLLWALPFAPNLSAGGRGVPLYSVVCAAAFTIVALRRPRSASPSI